MFHHLARSLGSHLEVSNFAREAGISHPTAKKYLNALQQDQLGALYKGTTGIFQFRSEIIQEHVFILNNLI